MGRRRRRELAEERLGGGEGAAAASRRVGAPREPAGIRALHRRGAAPGVAPHLLASEFDLDFSVPLRCSCSGSSLKWGSIGELEAELRNAVICGWS